MYYGFLFIFNMVTYSYKLEFFMNGLDFPTNI